MTGLSFDLTDEQEQLRQAVRDFTERECPKDVARRLEASKGFPEDLARRIAKAGLNGIGVPEEYGGQGGDLLDQTIVCEELSRTLGGLPWLWASPSGPGRAPSCTTGAPPRRSATCPRSRPATCGSPSR
jgi:acyl-CoA dehydrogenase